VNVNHSDVKNGKLHGEKLMDAIAPRNWIWLPGIESMEKCQKWSLVQTLFKWTQGPLFLTFTGSVLQFSLSVVLALSDALT